MTPVWLGLIGVALALPVPAALARTRWTYLAPRAGIVMWQALALAAILAVFGAGLSTALWLVTAGTLTPARVVIHFAVLALTLLVASRLAWAVAHVAIDTRARRRRHRDLVDLLADHDETEAGLRILTEQTPVAYCLPAQGRARVVVSQGTLDALDDHELQAVLEHERAHVRRRHDLVLEGFTALRRAFPRGPTSTDLPLEQSRILIELLADDAAHAKVGARPLATALVKLAGARTPEGALGAGSATLERLTRLDPARPGPWTTRWAAATCYAIALTALVAPTVFLAVPWISGAWAQLR